MQNYYVSRNTIKNALHDIFLGVGALEVLTLTECQALYYVSRYYFIWPTEAPAKVYYGPIVQKRKQFSGTDLPKYTQLKKESSNPGCRTPQSWLLPTHVAPSFG